MTNYCSYTMESGQEDCNQKKWRHSKSGYCKRHQIMAWSKMKKERHGGTNMQKKYFPNSDSYYTVKPQRNNFKGGLIIVALVIGLFLILSTNGNLSTVGISNLGLKAPSTPLITAQNLDSFFPANINDVVLHPENYIGKEFTFHYDREQLVYPPFRDFQYYLRGKTEEGQPVFLALKYDTFYCHTCQVTGVITSDDICVCGYYPGMENNFAGRQWFWDSGYLYVSPITTCKSKVENNSMCEPNTEQKRFYMQITKVVSLD